MFNKKIYIIDTNEDNDIISINDDYQEVNKDSSFINKKSEYNKKKPFEKFEIPNFNRLNNIIQNSNIGIETDVDPNFKDINLKKEEEKRRLKEVEEFEKRNQNNIIDFDEINNKEEEIEVEE